MENPEAKPADKPTLMQVLNDEVFSRRAALVAMIAMSSLYLWSFFQRVAVPGTIFDELQSSLKIDAAQVTGLAAIYLYIYASLQVVVGFLADRLGGVRVLLIGGSLLSIGSIAFPLSDSLSMLYFSRAVIGVGASFVFLGCAKELDSLFGPKGFVILIGPLYVVGGVGALLATYPLERAVSAMGWRHALLGAAGLTTLCLVTIIALLRSLKLSRTLPPAHAGETQLSIIGHVREIVFRFDVMPGGIAWILHFMGYFFLAAALGKKLLQDVAGFTSAQAAGTTFVLVLVAMVVTFASGGISRLFHDRRKKMGLFAVLVVAFGYLLLIACTLLKLPGWLYVAAFVIVAAGAGMSPVFNYSLKEIIPPRAYGFALGYYNGLVYVGVACFTAVSGFVLDHYRAQATVTREATIYPTSCYVTLLTLVLGMQIAAAIASQRMPETYGRPVHERSA